MDTDDLNILSIEQPRESERSILIKRGLEKRSQDEVIVINPTNQEFEVIYNLIRYRVPANQEDRGFGNGKTVLSRYVAENYINNMATKILNEQVQTAVNKENERRVQAGQLAMNKWEEQPTFESKLGILFNPDKLNEVRMSLYGGIFKKFGEEDVLMGQKKKQEIQVTDISKLMMDLDRKGSIPVISNVDKVATTDDLVDSIL